MKNKILISLLAITSVLITSCSVFDWFGGKIHDDEIAELEKETGTPDQRATPYDDSLKAFGKMLEAYGIPDLKVQSKPITNATAEKGLPDDVSKMIATGLNKIGKQIIYIPYDPTYYVGETTTGGKINRVLPQAVIAGGMTEYDKDLIEKKRGLKLEGQVSEGDFGSNYDYDGGAGYQSGGNISRLGLDLHILNYSTQAAVPGVQASNTINLRKTGTTASLGFFFQGSGFSFDYSLQKKQGVHYAIRLLVELSVLEVLGKYVEVPYWKCIPGAQPNNEMIARLRDEFDELPTAQKNAYLKEYLFLSGYPVDRGNTPFTDNDAVILEKAMKEKMAASQADLFMNLWLNIPIDQARARLKEAKRKPTPPPAV
ncbi:MAG TPA: hypothetical protein PK821_01040, partial [Victivallales bacterium]|nr:hypothetical protein [Victivallales bacterium]